MVRLNTKTPKQWLEEISVALAEIRSGKPFPGMWETSVGDANLFQLAPYSCLKSRRIRLPENDEEQLVRKALVIYFASTGHKHKHQARILKIKATVAFALCYISTLVALEYVLDADAPAIMSYCTDRLDVPTVSPNPT